jgi:hypothetical protein
MDVVNHHSDSDELNMRSLCVTKPTLRMARSVLFLYPLNHFTDFVAVLHYYVEMWILPILSN